jgi:LysM repeat protein
MNTKLIPALRRFFAFIDRNKQIIINFGAAFAGIWAFAKIQAGVTLAITAIKGLVGAYNTLKVAGLAAAIAQRMALNPLLGAAAGALLLGAMVKSIAEIKKTNEEVKDLKLNLEEIGNGVNYPTAGLDKLKDKLTEVKQSIKDFNAEIKKTFTELKTSWTSVVGKDFNAAITEGLLNPIDKLVTKTNTAVKAYQTASAQYQSAMSGLKNAQNSYTNAIKSGNKTLIASTESALKRAEALVKSLQDSMGSALKDIASLQQEMIDAVIEAEKKVAELRADRKTVLEDAHKEELQLQKDYNTKVLQLQRDAAKRSAEIVKQSVDQLRNIFKGATYRSIGDIFSGLTFEGKYLKGGTLEAITNKLADQAAKATTLADKAGKLQALGFTQTFIEEVVAQGPEVGGALADTILAGSPESVKQLQSYWLALEKITLHGVDSVAYKLNAGLTLATEELTAQLADVQTELTSALSEAFKEYSDALTAVQAKTAEQIKAIDSQIAELISKISQLRTALQSLSNLNAPGTVAPYVPPNVEAPSANIPPMSVPQTSAAMERYRVQSGDTLSAIAKREGISLSQLLKDNPKFTEDPKYQGGSMIWAGTVVNINANTNASSQSIANDVGWAIRTSSDVQYNVTSGAFMERFK